VFDFEDVKSLTF